jgi:SAM-dependent MidA family methyltransferase
MGTIAVMERNEPEVESNRQLVDELRGLIEREGPITFERFMRVALYHPEHGYYRHETARPGQTGDFLTAPEADPIFGQALARQLQQMDDLLGSPDPFTLREYGAGTGTLALAILDGLRLDNASLLNRLRYDPVEISPERAAELRDELIDAGYGGRLAEPSDEQLTGCVLANEFLDALPVHRVARIGGALREYYVIWRDGWFAEEPEPPSTPALERYLTDEGVELAEGQRAEINLEMAGWVDEVSRRVRQGYVLSIDYGYPATKLYGPEFPDGTLRTYLQHMVGDDPFRAVGRQDLTAHVDFSALERAARQHGLEVLGLTTQADFLNGAGIGQLLVESQQQPGMTYEEYIGIRAAVIRMIDPGAMGRFGVSILGRDVPREAQLMGLSSGF